MEPTRMTLVLQPRKLLRGILSVILCLMALLFVLDIAVAYFAKIPFESIRELFSMAKEDNLGAWFSWVLGLAVALAAFSVYLRERSRCWFAIGLFFSYLAMDDGAKIHERVGNAFGEGLGSTLDWFPSYPWQVVFMPVFATAAVLMLFFLWRDLKDWKLRLGLLAALGCYTVAVLLDYMEGVTNFYNVLGRLLGYSGVLMNHFGRVFEEFLEMTGTTVFLLTFLGRFFRSLENIEIHLASDVGESPVRRVFNQSLAKSVSPNRRELAQDGIYER